MLDHLTSFPDKDEVFPSHPEAGGEGKLLLTFRRPDLPTSAGGRRPGSSRGSTSWSARLLRVPSFPGPGDAAALLFSLKLLLPTTCYKFLRMQFDIIYQNPIFVL